MTTKEQIRYFDCNLSSKSNIEIQTYSLKKPESALLIFTCVSFYQLDSTI